MSICGSTRLGLSMAVIVGLAACTNSTQISESDMLRAG